LGEGGDERQTSSQKKKALGYKREGAAQDPLERGHASGKEKKWGEFRREHVPLYKRKCVAGEGRSSKVESTV